MAPHGTDDNGQKRPGMVPYQDVETALRHEVDVIAQRFPDTDRSVVEETVHEVFAELRADAEVETHVLALTRPRVYDRLEERGHPFDPPAVPASDTETAPDPATAPDPEES